MASGRSRVKSTLKLLGTFMAEGLLLLAALYLCLSLIGWALIELLQIR
jgi:hypothetical protein